MRDIYKPGEARNKLLDIKEEKRKFSSSQAGGKEGLPEVESANFWKPKNKKNKISKIIWSFIIFVILLAGGLGAWYYFDLRLKDANSTNGNASEAIDPELEGIDKKLDELDESQKNIDDFSDDEPSPAVDMNINY